MALSECVMANNGGAGRCNGHAGIHEHLENSCSVDHNVTLTPEKCRKQGNNLNRDIKKGFTLISTINKSHLIQCVSHNV